MIISGLYGHGKNEERLQKTLTSLTASQSTSILKTFRTTHLSAIIGQNRSSNTGEVLDTSNSLLVGKVFNKKTFAPVTFGGFQCFLQNYSVAEFVDYYWGQYVLVSEDTRTNSINILRDPTGQLPIFYAKLPKGGIVFSSKVSIIYEVLDRKPSYNWEYFSAYLSNAYFTSESTSFEGIRELPHGSLLNLSMSKEECVSEVSVAWDPLNYCEGYQGISLKKKEIIDTTTHVIKSWSKEADTISLDLSGGLDSSSLVLLLSQSAQPYQQINAINMFNPHAGDERRYARNVSQEANVKLIELDTSKSLPFSDLSKIPSYLPDWPLPNLTQLEVQKEVCNLFDSSKNFVHMSGHGGDHIFSCPPIVKSLADYLIKEGTSGFSSKLKEISTIYRKPLLPILKESLGGIHQYLFSSVHKEFTQLSKRPQIVPFFNKDIIELKRQVTPHPFFYKTNPKKALPGQYTHIHTIYEGLATIKGNIGGNHHSMFYPFFSQPLIELALSIPTYESYQEGYDRYPFRKAVNEHFRTQAVWRKDKGQTTGTMPQGIRKNEAQVLQVCMEGKLANMGLIDRDLLYKGIKDLAMGQTEYLWPIMTVVSAEMFMSYYH